MKRIFRHPRVLLLSIPVALVVALAIGCGSPSEPAPETTPEVVDTLSTTPADTLPPIDTTTGDKPPVPVTKS